MKLLNQIVALLLVMHIDQILIAQGPGQDPHLAYAYPAGCQQGKSCELVLGGQFLKAASEAYIAGEGVKVEIVKWYRPMTNGEYNNLRMALEQALETLIAERLSRGITSEPGFDEVALAAGITIEQQREMQIFRDRDRDQKRQPNDQLQEELTLRMTVAEDAELGKRELRLLTESSISNPIWLHVGRWPEVRETEPNDREPESPVSQFPAIINGQIMPGDIDKFSFVAKQGMKLVVEAAARDVIPYLADAVPGWFQASLTLSDSNGTELAYADSFHYRQDPVLYFEVPRDGTYTLQIHDSLYRGREDFVYRITLGQLPFVTSVFPLGARVDSELKIELKGWNLTQTSLDVKTMSRRRHRPLAWYNVPQQDGLPVRFPLRIDLLPETLDQESNNTTKTAQEITTRMTVNGHIDSPGDEDVFRIEGSGRLVAEVFARRLSSPLDSMLILTDSEGNELAFNDDYEDKTQGLITHHADSHLAASLPGAGTYFLHLTDAQQNGGKDFSYRLCLHAAQPDYELRVVPSSIIARAGAVVPITVFALRRDGFDQDIELALLEPPPGFRLDGATIPGNAERVQMTLTVPATPPKYPVVLEMEGSAAMHHGSGTRLVRPAVPAENMMQAFIWYHLVPVEDWSVIVSGQPGAKPPFAIALQSDRLKLPLGKSFILQVIPQSKNVNGKELRVELRDPPKGVSATIVTDDLGKFAIQLAVNADEAKPETRGNLLFRVFREWTPAPTEAEPAPKPQRSDYGYLPSVPFEIAKTKTKF